MKYELAATGRFKKDLKSIIKRGYDVEFLNAVVSVLISGEQLADKFERPFLDWKLGKLS